MEESDWLRQREGEQNGARGNDVRDKKITTVFPIAAIAALAVDHDLATPAQLGAHSQLPITQIQSDRGEQKQREEGD